MPFASQWGSPPNSCPGKSGPTGCAVINELSDIDQEQDGGFDEFDEDDFDDDFDDDFEEETEEDPILDDDFDQDVDEDDDEFEDVEEKEE